MVRNRGQPPEHQLAVIGSAGKMSHSCSEKGVTCAGSWNALDSTSWCSGLLVLPVGISCCPACPGVTPVLDLSQAQSNMAALRSPWTLPAMLLAVGVIELLEDLPRLACGDDVVLGPTAGVVHIDHGHSPCRYLALIVLDGPLSATARANHDLVTDTAVVDRDLGFIPAVQEGLAGGGSHRPNALVTGGRRRGKAGAAAVIMPVCGKDKSDSR